jgi:hypothetical protein
VSTSAKQGSLTVALLPSFVLYACAVALILLTRDSTSGIGKYWELYVPIVAVISLLSGWGQAYVADRSRLMYLIKQVIHWGSLIALLWLLQSGLASLGDAKYGLLLACLLAMSSLIAGLYLDLRSFFFGAYLATGAYLLAAPANTAILAPIGKALHIADAPSKPVTMIVVLAVVAFVISAFFLVTQRGAVNSKRNRA